MNCELRLNRAVEKNYTEEKSSNFGKLFPRVASGLGKTPTFPQPRTDSRNILAGLTSVRVMPGALNEAQAPSGSHDATRRHHATTRRHHAAPSGPQEATSRGHDLTTPHDSTRHHTTPHDTTRHHHVTPRRDAMALLKFAAQIRV